MLRINICPNKDITVWLTRSERGSDVTARGRARARARTHTHTHTHRHTHTVEHTGSSSWIQPRLPKATNSTPMLDIWKQFNSLKSLFKKSGAVCKDKSALRTASPSGLALTPPPRRWPRNVICFIPGRLGKNDEGRAVFAHNPDSRLNSSPSLSVLHLEGNSFSPQH